MTITQDEHTGLQAIEVTTETKINHAVLGTEAAGWTDEEQVDFLHAMAEGFVDMGGWGAFQMHYMEQSAERSGKLPVIRDFIERLHEYFKESND